MRIRGVFAAVAMVIACPGIAAESGQLHTVVPRDGFVPNAETAIAVAVAIWAPIYGRDKIEQQKPYRAQLRSEVWTVEGSLPPGHIGGVAVIEISRRDGRVLRVSHGQ